MHIGMCEMTAHFFARFKRHQLFPLLRVLILLLMLATAVRACQGEIVVRTALLGDHDSRVCVNDRVQVDWVLDDLSNSERVAIEVQNLRRNMTVAHFDVFQYDLGSSNDRSTSEVGEFSSSLEVVGRVPRSLERIHALIYCLLDGPFKIPKILAAQWSDVVGQSPVVILNFSEPTNQPRLHSAMALNDAIVFNNGDLLLETGYGTWSDDGEALTIADIDPSAWNTMITSIVTGELTADLKSKLLTRTIISHAKAGIEAEGSSTIFGELQGKLYIRVSSPGDLAFHLFVGEKLVSTAENMVDVEVCPEEVTIPTSQTATNAFDTCQGGSSLETCSRGENEVSASISWRPFFAINGVLAMPGDKWLKIPVSVFPAQLSPIASNSGGIHTTTTSARQGSWSLGLWIFLLEDPTDRFRGLFYKGDGGVKGRTPSAWLCPYSNHIGLRVTSNTSPDIGIDSTAALAPRSWNHVAFSFDNQSDGAFSATIFVNGAADVSMVFVDMDMIANNGPMYIGRDPSNKGSRSFVSLVRMWDIALSQGQVRALFQESKSLFFGRSSSSLRARFPAVTAIVSFMAENRTTSRENGDIEEISGMEKLGDSAYGEAVLATSSCKPFARRLEMYRIAADAGHVEGRVRYASLLLAGREQPGGEGSACGREDEAGASVKAKTQWNALGAKIAVEQLNLAVRQGSHRAAFMLATLVLSGLAGISNNSFSESEDNAPIFQARRISPSFQLGGVGVGAAVLDQWNRANHSATMRAVNNGNSLCVSDATTTARAIGLLHVAASGGHPEAQLSLALRYLEGQGVRRDFEAAAWYMGCAADAAYGEYHVLGQQPIIEKQRLTEENEATVAIGQQGEDDGVIQYQIHRAGQGHVPSQAALGDLYYWGARAIPRDHVRALEYFNAASAGGDNGARCAAAGMYLKGEGAEVNHTKAVELYELAAAENHVRALNGLGFEYFHGHALPRNLRCGVVSAGSCLGSCGLCVRIGGHERDRGRRGAQRFRCSKEPSGGGAGWVMGADASNRFQLLPQGRHALCTRPLCSAELGYEVSASNAAFLLDRQKIALLGDSFQGTPSRTEEHHTGSHRSPEWMQSMSVRWHIMAADKGHLPSFLAIGDAFFYGKGGLPRDFSAACWWYSRASSSGLVRGIYNLGYMYEHGLGIPRDYELAWTYYDQARNSEYADDRTDADQGLDGMPIELLVLLAKGRLLLNRASGGNLAGLWESESSDDHHRTTRDWLPGWPVPTVLLKRWRDWTMWLSRVWTTPAIYNGGDESLNTAGSRVQSMYTMWPKALLGLSAAAMDNIVVVGLLLSFVFVLLLKQRRRRNRIPVES